MEVATSSSTARERILEAAYDLFSRRGIRGVGIDEVIQHADVAKATLYRHFPSKDDLVLAFLEQREERWTLGLVDAQARKRGATPDEQLLAIFDVFHDWFHDDAFDACSFINVLLEMGWTHPLGLASIDHLRNIRAIVADLAQAAGLDDPEELAHSWHLLMKGSIVAAAEGDAQAAQRAKAMAHSLLEAHRPGHKPPT